MKIGILRRDGKKVHLGMSESIMTLIKKYFREKEVFLEKNEEEFTEMITFSPDINDNSKIIEFVAEVSKINPLYAVRLLY